VNLFFELYAVLVNLAYLPYDKLSLPPHKLPPAEIQRFATDIDLVVLDLIQRLPYVKGLYGVEIAPGTKSKNLISNLGFAQNPMASKIFISTSLPHFICQSFTKATRRDCLTK